MSVNGETGGKLDGAGDPGAMGGARRQPLKYKEGFGELWKARRARPQPRNSVERLCSFSHPNSPKIERFLPRSLGFDYLTTL